MSAIYFAIPTNAGQAKIANAIALGVPLKITHLAVGDGNGQPVTPNAAQTALVRERRRAPINTLFQDPTNQSQLVAEQIIPENVGDWWIREAGIFSEDGTLIAIANTPDTYKPLLSSGAGRTQVIRIVLIVSDTSAVELKIDPAVVLATRKYVDDLLAAHKQSRDHPAGSQTEKGMLRLATKEEAIAGLLDSVAVAPKEMKAAINTRYLTAGIPLPTADIGPIWHDDYNDWMTWQTFNQNGANYTGYASRSIGSLLLDTQPTPRAGYIKSGVQNLSRVTYAALRAWAIHHGLMVAPGMWAAGSVQFADNADGTTFRIYDVRGEFLRAWDDGRGVDAGRTALSAQGDAIRNIVGAFTTDNGWMFTGATGALATVGSSSANTKNATTSGTANTFASFNFDASRVVPTAAENRSRNTALPAVIKF
ncbi:phage tail protein [Aeromonas hydrophila]